MISILSQPHDLSFTGNTIPFRVHSDQYHLHEAVYPSLSITVNAKPGTGNSFEFSFINPVSLEQVFVRLLAVPSPIQIGQMPDASFGGTLDAYASALAIALQNFPILNANYTIETNGSVVILTALSADISLIPKGWTTSNATTSFSAAISEVAEKAVVRSGYEMKAEIYFESEIESNSFEMVGLIDVILSPDATGAIDLREILASEIQLASMDQVPVPDLTVLFYIQKTVKRYYVKFYEYWNDETTSQSITSKILHAHHGGIDEMEETDHSPQSQLAASKKFMTWWPSGKHLSLEQHDWLSWMNPNKTTEIFVRLRIYTNDGVVTTAIVNTSVKQFRTLTFQVGHNPIDIEQWLSPGETFNKWSVQIYNTSPTIALTEEFFFYKMDQSCNRNLILYFNSFGVPETFNTYADFVENYNVSREISLRSEQFNINRNRAQRFSFNTKSEKSYIATTQFLKQNEARTLEEILQTSQCFIHENNGFTPLVISSESITNFEQNVYLRQLKFEVLKAFATERNSRFGSSLSLELTQTSTTSIFRPIKNGIVVDSFGNASLYNSVTGALISTQTYDVVNGQWSFALSTEGSYEVEANATINGQVVQVRSRFDFVLKTVKFRTDAVGLQKITLGVSTAFAYSIEVCWGDSTIFNSVSIGTTTEISHTYASPGVKEIIFRSFDFSPINKFIADNFSAPAFYGQAKGIEFSNFKELEILKLIESENANTLMVNRLTRLRELECTGNTSISKVDLGFHPNLELADFNNCNLGASSIEQMLAQIWKFRKSFVNDPEITFIDNPGAGSQMTSEALAIINGTGAYVGEGLVSDYSFTINY